MASNTTLRRILRGIAPVLLACGGSLAGQTVGQYYFLREIPVGGIAGSPSLTMDPEGRRLYVTHSTRIEFVDLDTGTVAATLTNPPTVRGFAVAPKLHRGFLSNSGEGSVKVIDLATRSAGTKIKTGAGTTALVYEPGLGEVYAFNTRGLSVSVLDAASETVTATITLPAKPGSAAVDSGIGEVYCNFFDRNEVAVIHAKTRQLAAWPVAPGKEPAGLAVDPATHRVFVGCRNKMLVMLDGLTGKVVATAPVGSGVDATAFDSGTQLIFCAGSDGITTIAREDPPGKLRVVQTLRTEKNARIMALDPKTHQIYLATTDYEAQADPDPGERAPRARTLPDTFKLLVYGPAAQ